MDVNVEHGCEVFVAVLLDVDHSNLQRISWDAREEEEEEGRFIRNHDRAGRFVTNLCYAATELQ